MSSGASTPQGNRSPAPPDGAGAVQQTPSPFKIGVNFVRQYYRGMVEGPERISNFYRNDSTLSDGDGSAAAEPVSLSEYGAEKLAKRFYLEDYHFSFELGQGAIDAQESVDGGIILVVSGHVVYYPTATEEEDAAVDDPIRKVFVHTFFLKALMAGTKKSYIVYNDILRFLKTPSEVSSTVNESPPIVSEPVPVVPAATAKTTTTVPAAPPTPPVEPQQPAVPLETNTELPPAKTTVEGLENVVDEAPGGGVEETKDEMPDVLPPTPVASKTSAPKDDKPTNQKDDSPQKVEPALEKTTAAVAGTKSPVPPSSPKKPGSWASLVAGAGGNAAVTGSAVKAPPPPSVVKVQPKKVTSDKVASTNDKKEGKTNNSISQNNHQRMGNSNNTNSRQQQSKRDPDCTLVIKNLPDGIKESDVLGLFEPFASQTKTKVVGITVAAHRGIAFVDYDSIAPVTKATEQHKKEPLRLSGRVLEVDQKTAEQRARKAAQQQQQQQQRGGGNYRSGSPSNGGANRYGSAGRDGSAGRGGSGGGGGGGYRRRDGGGGGGGGRGDRGGGGMSGRGGRGGR